MNILTSSSCTRHYKNGPWDFSSDTVLCVFICIACIATCNKISQASPFIFAYWKWSNTEGYVALCTVCEMEVAKPGGEAKIVQAVQSVRYSVYYYVSDRNKYSTFWLIVSYDWFLYFNQIKPFSSSLQTFNNLLFLFSVAMSPQNDPGKWLQNTLERWMEGATVEPL